MVESNDNKDPSKKKETNNDYFGKRNMPLIFLLLLIVSIIGYFFSKNHWIEFTFAHLGGLFILGIIGYWSGIIALKKGYDYWKAFLMGFFLPIIFGLMTVFLSTSISCGGSISLAVAVLIVLIYSLVKPRAVNELK